MESKVYTTYSVGRTSQKQHAQNKDGVWYSRSQYLHPRQGFRYTPWVRSITKPLDMTDVRMMRIRLPNW